MPSRPPRTSEPAPGEGLRRLLRSSRPSRPRDETETWDAERAFQEAEVALRMLDRDKAEKALAIGIEKDPEHAACRTLLAWVSSEKRGKPNAGNRKEFYKEEIATLSKVLRDDPDHAMAYYYRARLMKLSGKIKDAYEDFVKAVELDPSNTDAAREVRELKRRYGRRGGDDDGAKGGGGLFGLLKKS